MTVRLASEVEDLEIYGTDRVLIGKVEHLLFHPDGSARVIGAQVRPPAAMVVVKRPETFLPLAAMEIAEGHALVDVKKLPSQRQSLAGLGHDPELTIIWTGMPVIGPEDANVGTISDIEFDDISGEVFRLEVTGGVVASTAVGRYIVPVQTVTGYEAGAVHVTLRPGELEVSGGLAKGAAAVAVAASEQMAKVGQAVEDTMVAAGGAAGTAIKVVADTGVVRGATKRLRSTWRDSVKAFKTGMKDE